MENIDTKMTIGGGFRCCIDFTDEELNKQVNIGDERTCQHCNEKFELVDVDKQPTWKPVWQIEK